MKMKVVQLVKDDGYVVYVSPGEVLQIIQSLTTQLLENSTNSGYEFITEDGEIFTINVKRDDMPSKQQKKLVSYKFSPEMIEMIDDESRESGVPRTRLVEKAVLAFLKKEGW
jgi:hypothetical protein